MQIRKATHDAVSPLINDNCSTLILGSILSPKSAQARFYYAHPQNRFWKVLAAIYNCAEVPKDNFARAEFALSHGIALWDVISCCDILGASDSTIKNVVFNDIAGLLDSHRSITRIFTTGKKAHELLGQYNKTVNNRIISEAVCLPSTSPQNCAVSLQTLIDKYKIIVI